MGFSMKFLFLVIVLSFGIILEGCNKKVEKIESIKKSNIALDLTKFTELINSQDVKKREDFFNKLSILAENNDSDAQNLMGVTFENGLLNRPLAKVS